MIQTDKDNVVALTKMLLKLSKENELDGYFPWREYMRLSLVEKHELLSNLRTWNTIYKSIVVGGFKDTKTTSQCKWGSTIRLQKRKIH
jgi:hypothetical protein